MAAGVSDGALIIDTGLDNKGFIRDAGQFKKAVATLTQAVKTSGQQMAGGMNGYLKALQKAGGVAKAATGEQAALQKEIDKTAAAIERMEARQTKMKALAEQRAQAQRDELRAQIEDEVKSGIGYGNWELTPKSSQDQAMEAAMRDFEGRLAAIQAEPVENTESWRSLQYDIDQAKAKMAGLQAQMAGLVGAAAPAVQGMAGGFANVAAAAGRALVVIGKFAGHAAIGFLKRLAEGAKNAAIQLAKRAGSAISGGMKKLGGFIGRAARSMLGFNKAQKLADGGMKKSLMSILKYGLGIRGLFALFRKLRTAIKEGFEAMSKANPQVKASVDGLKASLNGLKGSLATAFAPILTAVAPALTTLINMLTSAINAIGAFMAALTGQKTYQRAVSGLEATGGAASGAAGDVKKLKRELAGFDELNILGKSDSSGGGGGGGGGSGSAFSYETEEISSGITDFVQKLKDLWAAADYEGIGREIAGAINGAFAKARQLISWDTLGDKITQAVDAITGIFNGLVDGIDWDGIGRTFGTGINTILNTVNQLLTKIDWANLGKKLAEGLNGLVDEVDWGLLGQTFANRINAIFGVLSGAVSSFKWGNAGTAFANTLNGLFNSIDWSRISATVSNGINGVTQMLRNLVANFRWESAGAQIGNTMNELFAGINWNGIADLASTSINRVFAGIRSLISSFNFEGAAANLANAFNRLFDGISWEGITGTVSEGFNRVVNSIKTFVTTFRWGDAGTRFGNALNELFGGINWTNLGETAASLIAGPLEALKNAVSTFSFSDAAASFAATVNGFFSNEQLWKDAGTIVSDSVKGLFTWGAEFLDGLDAEQIAADVIAFFDSVDWDGIAKAIWAFAISAMRKLGNLVLALIFGPDYKDKTKVQQEIEDYYSGLTLEPPGGRDYSVNFGLNLNADVEWDAFNQLGDAITEALKTGNWVAPIGLDVPDESIEAARQEFIKEWNLIHPEAPIKVDGIAGKQMKVVGGKLAPDTTNTNTTNTVKGGVGAGMKSISGKFAPIVSNTSTTNTVKGAAGSGMKSTSGKYTPVVSNTSTTNTVKAAAGAGMKASGKAYVVGTANTTTSNTVYAVAGVGMVKLSGTNSYSIKAVDTKTKDTVSGASGTGMAYDKDVGKFYAKVTDTTSTDTIKGAAGAGMTANKNGTKFTPNVNDTSSTVSVKKGWTGKVLDSLGLSGLKATIKVGLAVDKKKSKAVLTGTTGNVYNVNVRGEKALGGIITAAGRSLAFASGGMLRGGHASLWSGVQKYASGTNRAHGSLFVAGEAGPEIIGHVNGRTEILNKSQLAQTMQSAVASGMLTALSRVQVRMPAVASGSLVPYEVSAQIAKSTADLQGTLNANNEDLIQTIISVAGQLVAAVGRIQPGQPSAAGLTAQQVIDEINRRTLMFGASPLKGV